MRLRRLIRPEVTVPMGSRRIRIDLRDRIIAKRLYLGVAWEQDLQELLAAMSLRGGVCLDVGANIGVHSLTMSEFVGPAGRVYAFEPERRNFALLEANLKLNRVTNVTAAATALGDSVGTCRLAVSPNNFGDHRVPPLRTVAAATCRSRPWTPRWPRSPMARSGSSRWMSRGTSTTSSAGCAPPSSGIPT